ncbi:MAG: glycosyltransferase [Chloroflexi bacterium]|nr:glycosyltransferase [Chloroflexota bacterium]
MKLAIVTTYPPGKGSLNEYAYHLVEGLKTKEEVEEIILLVDELPTNEPDEVYPSSEDGSVHIIPCWRFNDPTNPLRIAHTLRENKPDAVLFNIQFASFGDRKIAGGLGLLAPLFSKLLKFPTVVLLHNIMETVDLKSAGFGTNPITQAVIRFAGTILTHLVLSADLVALTIPRYVEILQEKYRANNAVLIPHGTFNDIEQPSMDLPEGPLQIMTFGKFGTYKKVEILIEAFEILQNRSGEQPVELVIAGTSSPNAPGYLEGVAERCTHIPNIRFTGYVEEEDVPKIFGDAAVVVFPYTSTTGSSGVLHQAGSFGKAAVLPEIGDFIELIGEEGYTGETFLPDSSFTLAKAISRVIDNSDNRITLGQQNYLAARGLPIAEVADWYLLHYAQLQKEISFLPATQSI